MSYPKIISLQRNTPEASVDRPRPDRLLEGNPLRTTWNYFTNPTGEISSGIWACEPGSWRIHFADNKDEFFCVIEGVVRLTDAEGQITEVRAGEAAIIPAGFQGIFGVVESVKKYYVVIERTNT